MRPYFKLVWFVGLVGAQKLLKNINHRAIFQMFCFKSCTGSHPCPAKFESFFSAANVLDGTILFGKMLRLARYQSQRAQVPGESFGIVAARPGTANFV